MGRSGTTALGLAMATGVAGILFSVSVFGSFGDAKGIIGIIGWTLLALSSSLAISSTIFGIVGISREEQPSRSSRVSVCAIPIVIASIAVAFAAAALFA